MQLQQVRGAGLMVCLLGSFMVAVALALDGHGALASLAWGAAAFCLISSVAFAVEGQSTR